MSRSGSDKRQRTEQVAFRVYTDEYQRIKAASQAAGMSIGGWVRSVALNALSDAPDQVEALDLEAIKARADAATPGPWDHVDHGPGPDSTFMGCGSVITMNDDLMGGNIAGPTGDCYPRSGYSPWEDMAFIAAARDDVPALVAEVGRLTSENEDLIASTNYWREQSERLRAQKRSALDLLDGRKTVLVADVRAALVEGDVPVGALGDDWERAMSDEPCRCAAAGKGGVHYTSDHHGDSDE